MRQRLCRPRARRKNVSSKLPGIRLGRKNKGFEKTCQGQQKQNRKGLSIANSIIEGGHEEQENLKKDETEISNTNTNVKGFLPITKLRPVRYCSLESLWTTPKYIHFKVRLGPETGGK